MPRRGAQGAPTAKVSLCRCLLLLLLVRDFQAVDVETCKKIITDTHLQYLQDMIDSQLESSCILEVNLAAKGKLSDYCFLRGSMYQMEDVFKHMKFKKDSLNFNHTRDLKYLYTFGIMDCMLKDEEGADMEPPVCLHSQSVTLVEMLQKVKDLFLDSQRFLSNPPKPETCDELYECTEEDVSPIGPSQGDFPPPNPPVPFSTTNQSPPRDTPAFPGSKDPKGSPCHTPHTCHSAGDTSVKSPNTDHTATSPERTPQNTDTSSVIVTEILADSEPPHVNTEPSHANTEPSHANTEPSHANTEPSHANTEPSQAITEASHAITKPSHANMEPSHANTNPPHANMELPHGSAEPPQTYREPSHAKIEPTYPITVTPHTSMEPSNTSPQPPDASTQPPHASMQSPHASTQPPHASMQSPHASTQPPQASTQPPHASTQPPHASTQPPHTSTQPPHASTQPPHASTQPPHASTQPPHASTQPPHASTNPLPNPEISFTMEATLWKESETTDNESLLRSPHTTLPQKLAPSSESSQEVDASHTRADEPWRELTKESALGWASSPSTVTKMRRSIVTSEERIRTRMGNTASSTPEDSDSSHPLTPVTLVPRGEVTKVIDLGWAALDLSSIPNMEPTRSEQDAPTTGGLLLSPESVSQALVSDVASTMPLILAHGGERMHSNPRQREEGSAALVFQDREDSAGGPSYGSNLLPIIETEQQSLGGKPASRHDTGYLYLLVPCIVGILLILLSVCGLLYYKHRYRILKRQVWRERRDPELPEERPLQTQELELDVL
ncbi:macrophage colony-stimulating factor 1 [Ascaphus truei]|uniref:macrophage colony-stimulating factor 1 n=1 Tax=Ascaphus truei TaxID=8439 RepID=UPI003F59E7D6